MKETFYKIKNFKNFVQMLDKAKFLCYNEPAIGGKL